MVKNQNIICISSIDWDFVWQGHQEIMSAFAKESNRVLFIENTGIRAPGIRDIPRLKKRLLDWLKSTKGFRRESKNLYVYSPLILPFPYSKIARHINKYLLLCALRRWMKTMNFHDPIVWAFLPTNTTLDIEQNIDKKILVYYCIADFYELAAYPDKTRKAEERLIKDSDIIFAQGKVLQEKCLRYNKNVHIFPFGVNVDIFNDPPDTRPFDIPADIRNIQKPIIGYIGGLHRHIDYELIRFIALSRPQYSFVLIGPVQTDISRVSSVKNIHVLGKKEFRELPRYLRHFDAGIIPYLANEYTRTVFPTKLNEYHAMGIPVVSTNLPEIAAFNLRNNDLVFVAGNSEAFGVVLDRAINDNGPDRREQRKECARGNDWKKRIKQMSALIEQAVLEKASSSDNWQKNLLTLYDHTRKKILKAVFVLLCFYGVVFYTPLVWMIAGPLKIADPAQKCSVIVVFAGGVGESGKAGEGYEERVQQAVQLYKEGYADNIILSSGYVHVFKEPFVMKALAVSLGVPEKAIYLEDESANTYENVLYTTRILSGKGWDRIILVSSPYHMLRASLVFKKIAAQIKVIYSPIPRSLFYSHPILDANGRKTLRQISIQQIQGILHEYLGIIYYWFKGYI